jgi:hypothetical protein
MTKSIGTTFTIANFVNEKPDRIKSRSSWRLEPNDGKLSRSVLRGVWAGNSPDLPGVLARTRDEKRRGSSVDFMEETDILRNGHSRNEGQKTGAERHD